MAASQSYPLFGGAISVNLPAGLLDASDIRQVPDTEEVLLAKDSDISYIFEILQRVEPDELEKAAEFHFDALAHDNSANSTRIHRISAPAPPYPASPPAQPIPTILYGEQMVSKFNRTELDRVQIMLALFRVNEKGTDIVFSINSPVKQDGEDTIVLQKVFEDAVQSFRILDFGLFA
ncbi:hypothetical protein BOTBODRAFT_34587 [Botryobasidium botryosum FD-172 SS1]|uniref:Mog1p/PsbP-like protein n=1 Tax=Botryobasidium botryosum (strain FD-172 SS1) TaxID=930990 RepID=A0A067MC88_BOTB1|nr:hypothetical protein BOTBODRAFT_34587 [Botryobasidium botryosum FD-172 SS1]